MFTRYVFPAMNKYWIFCRIRYSLYPDIFKVKPGWLIWGDKAHLGVDVIWDSVSGSAVLHDLLPLKGTWKCQNVTACPCEKHCSVGFGPFPQTPYTFEVSSQIFMALFCILHTLVTFLVKLWKHEWDVKMSECYCMPVQKALLSWVRPFSADCIHFWSF